MMGWLSRIGSFFMRLALNSKGWKFDMKNGNTKICELDGMVFSGDN